MKFFSFFILYAKRTVRDKMFTLIMLAFPLLLIWILGSAFGGIMGDGGNDNETVIAASLIYTVSEESQMSATFTEYMTGENEYFSLTRFDDIETGKEKIVRNEYDAFIVINGETITLYKNSYYNFDSSLGELIIKAFADDYNLMYEIAMTDPSKLQEAGSITESGFTEEVTFDRQRTAGAMDYYGVSMSTMFIFYGMIFLGTYFAGNRLNKTEDRIKASNTNILTYQWGTALGNIVLILVQSIIIFTAGILIFKVYWGDALGIGILVVFAEIIMISSIGTLLGLTIKSENAIAGISQLVIPAIVFLGDGYTHIGGTGVILAIKKISPMYWINHGIFDAIYLNDNRTAFTAIIICLSIAVFSTVIVAALNRNRRIANG